MSISYFVEGKIKTHFKGDIKVYSKENIVNSAHQTIIQTGKEKGISYGKADTLHQNDKPINGIDVTLNLFFDGTQNNKVNSILGEKSGLSNRDDDSYTNDFSNVAKGYDAVASNVENQIKVYIEGIGTVDGKRDTLPLATGIPNNAGSPLGTGDRGIKAKVTRGCVKAAQELSEKYENKEIAKLKINVFGFSRGAAAARHFVHIASTPAKIVTLNDERMHILPPYHYYEQPNGEKKAEPSFTLNKSQKGFVEQYGYFGACLLKNKVNVKHIEFNFAGLYDTVASHGVNHRGTSILGVKIKDNDSEELHLDAIKNCKVIVHFVTQEEFRENFSLTNIKKSGIKGIELTLPGVHSDIGGGYKNKVRENVLIYQGTKENCEKYKKILTDEGWYKDDKEEIYIQRKRRMRTTRTYRVSNTYQLIGKRTLLNEYDRIPLLRMIEYSKQFQVVYEDSKINDYQITDPFINTIYIQLSHYLYACHTLRNGYIERYNKGEKINPQKYLEELEKKSYLDYIDAYNLKELRNKYLHWSANHYKTGMGPRVEEPLPFKQRTRTNLEG